HGDLRSGVRQSLGAVTLVAVEMGVQHPLDLLDSELCQRVDGQTAAGIDHDRPLAPFDQVDVADVLDPVQARAELLDGKASSLFHYHVTSVRSRRWIAGGHRPVIPRAPTRGIPDVLPCPAEPGFLAAARNDNLAATLVPIAPLSRQDSPPTTQAGGNPALPGA